MFLSSTSVVLHFSEVLSLTQYSDSFYLKHSELYLNTNVSHLCQRHVNTKEVNGLLLANLSVHH